MFRRRNPRSKDSEYFTEEKIRQRIHAQWRRRAWFVSHALVFVSAMLITTFFFRGSLRVMTIAFAIWACVVAIHAVIFYLMEERDLSVQRAMERVEERKRKNEDLVEADLPISDDEEYVIGADGEVTPLDDLDDDHQQQRKM